MVEALFDRLKAHLVGLSSVAPMGSAMPEQQEKFLVEIFPAGPKSDPASSSASSLNFVVEGLCGSRGSLQRPFRVARKPQVEFFTACGTCRRAPPSLILGLAPLPDNVNTIEHTSSRAGSIPRQW